MNRAIRAARECVFDDALHTLRSHRTDNHLAAEHTWSFTTEAVPFLGGLVGLSG